MSPLPARAPSPLVELIENHPTDLPLDRAVALLAAEEQPGVDADSVLTALDELAAPLHIAAGASPFEAIARLNQRLFGDLGFSGDRDDYYAPRNSFINQVVERRRGLPIALSVIYVEVARRAGVELDGVGFPGHFLVGTRARGDEPRFFVDPFYAGRVHTQDDLVARLHEMKMPLEQHQSLLSPSSSRLILLRMTYNLKGSYLRLRQLPEALRQIDRVLVIAPERYEEHRDRGLLLAEAGRGSEALVSLHRYLELAPNADDRDIIIEVVRELDE
ncbi:MAG: tetratricopeptide repeat protein [Deltaproteobacteria bacterium]|nr:tetratricopeptide repeat protein [Deltaproteobacteria bacterium]